MKSDHYTFYGVIFAVILGLASDESKKKNP